jgi:hypothetical protein
MIWMIILETQSEPSTAMRVNTVDIGVLMLLSGNMCHLRVQCMQQTQMQVTLSLLLGNQIKPPALPELSKRTSVNLHAMMLLQDTMLQPPPRLPKRLAPLEPIRRAPANPRVTTLQQDTT